MRNACSCFGSDEQPLSTVIVAYCPSCPNESRSIQVSPVPTCCQFSACAAGRSIGTSANAAIRDAQATTRNMGTPHAYKVEAAFALNRCQDSWMAEVAQFRENAAAALNSHSIRRIVGILRILH